MKIKLLGTGAGTMETRYKTCIFVPLDNENNLLLDTSGGTEIITQFTKAKIDPVCINHIFISHLHFDHCLGLPAFLFYLATDRKEERPEEMRIYSNSRIIDGLKDLLRVVGASALERWGEKLIWIETEIKKSVKLTNNSSLTTFPAKGRESLEEDDLSCLIKISEPKKEILFTGDTAPNEYLEKYAREVDLLIHDATLPHKKVELAHRHGHSTARDAGELAQRAKAKQLVLTHFYKDELVKESFEEAKKYFSGQVHAAEDFLEIEI